MASEEPAIADRPRRLPWAAGLGAAAVLLFWCHLLESRTTSVNADSAGQVLQGWDMLHGNPLLRGWFLGDVSFYTFEIPVDGLVATVSGLQADVVHVTGALFYTLLVLTAALLARGQARGPAANRGVPAAHLGATRCLPMESKASWYDPAVSQANFVVTVSGPPVDDVYAQPAVILARYGAPASTYLFGRYTVMVYDYDLLSRVRPPVAGRR